MLNETTEKTKTVLNKAIRKTSTKMNVSELNTIISLSTGTAEISGLGKAKINELLTFKNGVIGMVHTLKQNAAGVIFLSNADTLKSGDRATRTERVLDIPVGPALLGRVINPLGQPLDNKGIIKASDLKRSNYLKSDLKVCHPYIL